MPNKANSEQLERVQKQAPRWVLGPDKDCYERLIQLKLLPPSLFIEMHDVLIGLAMLQNNYDIEIGKALQNARDLTRQSQSVELPKVRTRLQKTDDNFFARTKRLYNCLIRACPRLYEKPDKRTLADIYANFFKRKHIERNKCTWRLLCRCGNYIFVKLRQT